MSRAGPVGILIAFAAACWAAWSWLLWKGPWFAPWPPHLPLAVALAAAIIADRLRASTRPSRAWTAGLLLCVVGGLALGFAAAISTSAHSPFPEALSAWNVSSRADPALDRGAFFAARGSPAQSQVALANTLWGLTLLSGLLFFILLVVKPDRPSRGSTSPSKNLWEPWN